MGSSEKLYTVKEAAEMLQKKERHLRRLCKLTKIEAITVNSNQYRITHKALCKFAQANRIELNPIFPDLEQAFRPPSNSSVPNFSLLKETKKGIHPKAKEIALARQDVLNLWEDFRSKAEKKTSADKDFITAFNSGVLAPEINKKIGKISKNTLYRWKSEFQQVGNYEALVPQYNYGSSFANQTELTPAEKKYFLDLILQPNKINVGAAHRLTKYMLEKQGIYEIHSYATYKRFADWFKSKHYDVWMLMRHGQKALLDNVAPYIERDASVLNVGDVIIADGHVLDFQVINPFNGKPCRATLVGYTDWKSGYLAGYEIMLTENTQCIASALRNTVINLGKIPKVAYQDNGRAFRAKFFTETKSLEECGFNGLFGKLGIVPVFAKPYNARAKVIERFFKEFTETFEKLLPSYVGNSPTNKPAYMMRNEKFHKSIHNKFVPTIEQAHQMIDAWLDFLQTQPCPNVKGKTIGEVFFAGCGEGVDIDVLDDLMLASDSRKIGRNGVKFLNNNYFCQELYGITDKVEIRYSMYDLSYIKIYTLQGDYLGKATTNLKIHPMANVLGDKQDVYSLKKAISDNRKLEKATIQKARQLLPHLEKNLEWQKEIKTEPLKVIDCKPEQKQQYSDLLTYDENWKPKKDNDFELKYVEN